MPKRNLTPTGAKVAPPMDSLGRIRVYFDVDRQLSIALALLATKHHTTRREMIEDLIRAAVTADPDVAKVAGINVPPAFRPPVPAKAR